MTGATGQLVSGRYRLVEAVGRGGMGRVWRGHDEVLDREVAVKEVLLGDGVRPELRAQLIARTEREARAAARLRHPNIVTVHDVTQHDGTPWIVMEYIAGPSLGGLLDRERQLGWERAAGIGAALADALTHAHAAGVVHRDLKPDNVLLDGERPVITDFGIARVLDATHHLTVTNSVIGTPQFMPPEQLEGKRVEAPADLWALGATLYTAVEGRPPFHGDTLTSIVVAVLTQPVPPPGRAGPLAELLVGLMDKEPGRRPDAPSVAERLRALGAGAGAGPVAPRVPAPAADPVPVLAPAPAPAPAPSRTTHGASPIPTVPDSPAAIAAAPTVSAPPAPRRRPTPPPAPPAADTTPDFLRGPSRRSLLIGGFAALAATGGAVYGVTQLNRNAGGPDANTPTEVTLDGHNSTVETVAFSPDGKLLASGDMDGLILVRDAATHAVKAKFTVPKLMGTALAFSNDSRIVAVPCTKNAIRLLDVTTRTQAGALTTPNGYASVVAFHPDGRTLATAGEAKEIRLWDLATRTLRTTITGFTDDISALAFSPDGKTLAASTMEDGRIWLTKPAPDSSPVQLPDPDPAHKNFAESMAFSPDSRRLAVVRSGPFDLWDIPARTYSTISGPDVGYSLDSVAFSPDGKTLATADSLGNGIQVWNASTRTLVKDFTAYDSGARAVAFSPDGKTIASGGESRNVVLRPAP